jgi:hypothetical protein
MPAQPPGTALSSAASATRFSVLNPGVVRRLTAVDLTKRYVVAQEFLEGKIRPSAPAPEAPKIYVAGFGCIKIPLAPNPNVNYSWS